MLCYKNKAIVPNAQISECLLVLPSKSSGEMKIAQIIYQTLYLIFNLSYQKLLLAINYDTPIVGNFIISTFKFCYCYCF